ncbi:hypothetical protein RB614_37475 [Phytohabitans sp. ZYX-F-186]|uniref:Tyr recombinase domain-containing protein n=1 Tax=Phytohabitans maris TaxID=3071409 RepID=A0ABU0ZUM8_9ACTN|nr:hypothetical protein [Phytohabitans sp. ZYX-F-186]MDQ7910202.1 hypothetical protein [Phytohabitans sp. ZYX-F-186]
MTRPAGTRATVPAAAAGWKITGTGVAKPSHHIRVAGRHSLARVVVLAARIHERRTDRKPPEVEAGLREGDAMRIFGWKTRAMLDRYAADAAQRRAVKAARRLSHADRI